VTSVRKAEMSKISADLITQVHALENKMGKYMRVIRGKLETQIGDVRWPSRTEGRLDKQQESVASIFEQQTCGRKWRPLGENSRPI